MAGSIEGLNLAIWPGESVVAPVEILPHHRGSHLLDVTDVMMATAGVADWERMGSSGPPLASRALRREPGEGLYEAVFSRDALVMVSFVAEHVPQLAISTLVELAKLQGTIDRAGSDTEKRGQIPHEHREVGDPIREEYSQRFGWCWPYFGSIDATPMFVKVALETEQLYPGTLAQPVTGHSNLASAVAEALQWVLRRLSDSPLGLIETEIASNGCWQVWEDSPDIYHHADGRLVKGSLAPLEVQSLAYDALAEAADWLESQGPDATLGPLDSGHLRAAAARLQQAVLGQMWIERTDSAEPGGYLASAIERNGDIVTPLTVRNVNMGLVLDGRLLEGGQFESQRQEIVKELLDPRLGMCRPSGIVCIGPESPRFRTEGYHNGSIWPWTTYAIARGLARHGYLRLSEITRRLADHCSESLRCYPEYVQGHEGPVPTLNEAIVTLRSPDGRGGHFEHKVMQPPQHFQGWTAYGYFWSQQQDAKAQPLVGNGRASAFEQPIVDAIRDSAQFAVALAGTGISRLHETA